MKVIKDASSSPRRLNRKPPITTTSSHSLWNPAVELWHPTVVIRSTGRDRDIIWSPPGYRRWFRLHLYTKRVTRWPVIKPIDARPAITTRTPYWPIPKSSSTHWHDKLATRLIIRLRQNPQTLNIGVQCTYTAVYIEYVFNSIYGWWIFYHNLHEMFCVTAWCLISDYYYVRGFDWLWLCRWGAFSSFLLL